MTIETKEKIALGAMFTGSALQIFYLYSSYSKDHSYFPTALDADGILNKGLLNLGSMALAAFGLLYICWAIYKMMISPPRFNQAVAPVQNHPVVIAQNPLHPNLIPGPAADTGVAESVGAP